MSRLWTRVVGLFSNRSFVGMDKTGNKYFTRIEEIDGIMKEKRWVKFKGDQDPTSIPVEWICWLNGQRKIAPTPENLGHMGLKKHKITDLYALLNQSKRVEIEEMAQLEARREQVKMNVALLKKEEEERKAREGKAPKIGKTAGPDLKSFIQQFPTDSEGTKIDAKSDKGLERSYEKKEEPESSEPTGSGESFRPGTWQPPM